MANILWAGSEGEAFATTTPLTPSTNAGSFDSNFSRGGVELGANIRCNRVAFGDIAHAWFHYRWSTINTGGQAVVNLCEFFNSSNVGVLRLRVITSTTVELQYWNGSAWTLIGSAFNPSFGSNTVWDIQCLVDGTTGRFAVYKDGALEAELTGDTDFFSGSAVDYVQVSTWGATNPRAASEFIIADDSTLGMRLATLVPGGAGASTAWTGTFADVDEQTVNDGDFIQSTAANDVELFTLSNLSATALLLTPVAVINSARARNAATGPQNLQLALRTNSNDYFGGNQPNLTTSFTNGFQEIWNTNPNTAAPWTTTEIDALEIGDKSIT